MADFTAVSSVSRTLSGLLNAHFMSGDDPRLSTVSVHVSSPTEMREDGDEPALSVWLYRVTRNQYLLNHPPARTSPTTVERHPLPVNLHYLITPFAAEVTDKQDLLGRVLQTFNDHPILRGEDLDSGLGEGVAELRVSLEMLSLEDLTRVWNALEEPYQLSVTYEVRVAPIDSAHEPRPVVPVLERDAEFVRIVGTGGS